MFAPCADMVKYRLFVQKKLHSKFSYGYVEGNFQNTSNKNSSENEKKSVQWAKKVKIFKFFVFLTPQIICTKI